MIKFLFVIFTLFMVIYIISKLLGSIISIFSPSQNIRDKDRRGPRRPGNNDKNINSSIKDEDIVEADFEEIESDKEKK